MLIPSLTLANSISDFSPYSHYTFDSVSTDSTSNALTLTQINSPTFLSGLRNNAVNLVKASGQYLSRADGDYEFNTSFWCSVWLNADFLPSSGGEMSLFGKWNSSGNNRGFVATMYNNSGTQQIAFFVSPNGVDNVGAFADSGMSSGTWYHYVAVFQANTSIRQYVNGTQINNVTTSVPSYPYGNTASFMLGSHTSSGGNHFDGLLDEFTCGTGNLSSDSVTELYNAGVPLPYEQATSTPGSMITFPPLLNDAKIESMECVTVSTGTNCILNYASSTSPVTPINLTVIMLAFIFTVWVTHMTIKSLSE